MRTLVVLALLGCAYASPFLQYTPEVAAERARFQQLYNAQAALAAAAPDGPFSYGHHQQASTFQHAAPVHHTTKWQGPLASTIPAGVQGALSQVADTADVTAARNAFLAAYRAQVAATTGHNVGHIARHQPAQQTFHSAAHFNVIPGATQKWTGPVAATIPAGVNGQVIPVSDTADVIAARNAFFSSYNAALSATRPVVHHHQPSTHHHFGAAPVQNRWTGPMAATIPAGLPGAGAQVGQTADVAAATAAFQRAYSAAVAATTGRRF